MRFAINALSLYKRITLSLMLLVVVFPVSVLAQELDLYQDNIRLILYTYFRLK